MTQKWYQKTSVQAALVSGGFLLIATLIGGMFGLFKPSPPNIDERFSAAEDQLLGAIPETPYHRSTIDQTKQDSIRSLIRTVEKLYEEGATVSSAETFYRMGNYYFSVGDYKRAIELYKRALQLRPDWEKPRIALGLTYQSIGKWKEALAAYQAAGPLESRVEDSIVRLRDRMNRAMVLLNIGGTYMSREDYKNAALYCEKSIALHPTSSAYRTAALAYEKLGDNKKEYVSLTRFIELQETYGGESEETRAARRRLKVLEKK